MNTRSKIARIILAGTVLASVAALRPREAGATVYGLWRNSNGDLACGADCVKGQQCCEIKILPTT